MGRHFAPFKAVEHLIYCRQRLQFDVRLDLALRRESQSLGHVLARADQRTARSDAVQNHVKQRECELAVWKTGRNTGAAFAGYGYALFKCRQGRRGVQHTVVTTVCRLLNGIHSILSFGTESRPTL